MILIVTRVVYGWLYTDRVAVTGSAKGAFVAEIQKEGAYVLHSDAVKTATRIGPLRPFDRMGKELRSILNSERGAMLIVMGLACVLTSFSGMRLNTLDGIYPVELSLVLRHLIGGAAALLAAIVYQCKPGTLVLSKDSRRVVLLSCCFSLTMILRYSHYLFITTSGPLVLVGKLFEEFFGVLLILVWAERMIPRGLRFTIICFGAAITCMAGFQILLTFFQRVPCMVMLSVMPIVAAVLFCVHGRSAVAPCAPSCSINDGIWPIDTTRWSRRLLYLGILFGFIYIEGQILTPSLDFQQQSMASQLSIALGNGIAGFAILELASHLDSVRAQPRSAISLMFLAMFALVTISFSFMSYLDSTLITVYLALASIGSQLTTLMVWTLPFSRLGSRTTPYTMVSAGYGGTLVARAFSTATMCAARVYVNLPTGLIMGFVLAVVFVLCIACILQVPEGASVTSMGGPAIDSVPTSRVATPFKDVIAELSSKHALTQQESRVLALCAKGKNARYISEELGISMNTTKSHMRTLYAKIDIHSQQELIKLVDEAFERQHESHEGVPNGGAQRSDLASP